MPVPTLQTPKMAMIIILKKAEDVSSPYPCLTIPKGHLACTGRQTDRQTDRQDSESRTQKNTHANGEKKNTGRAGLDLVKGAEHDVRVELGVRVQDEEALGETQTPNGVWVSPAPEKEKSREKNVGGEHTKQQKKERGDTNINAKQGAGLKGHQTKQNSDPRDQIVHTNNPNI